MPIKDRGFASMSPARVKEIAAMGGRASHRGGFADKEFASAMGQKGGRASKRGASKRKSDA